MNTDFSSVMYCDHPTEIKQEKKYMSRFFMFFTLAYILAYALVLACSGVLYVLSKALDIPSLYSNTSLNAVSSINTPVFFVLLGLYVNKSNKSRHPVMDKMSPYTFLGYIAVCMFFMVIGSLVGNVVSQLVNFITGSDSVNVVEEFINETNIFEMFLYAVVMAPVFEELVFRKLVIDCFSKYGTGFCIFISGLTFGLFHGNFYQFFYAFTVGSVMALVYCVYGKIWHTILLHAIMNFVGSIVPMLLGFANMTSFRVTLGVTFYFVLYVFVIITGGVLFFANVRKVRMYYVSGVLLKPYKVLFKSAWFIVLLALASLMFTLSFLVL